LIDENSINNKKSRKQISCNKEKEAKLGMPSLQLYAGLSSFETISPAFKSSQSWRLKIFSLGPPLVLRLMMKNFRKLSFGTSFKKFSPAYVPKRHP